MARWSSAVATPAWPQVRESGKALNYIPNLSSYATRRPALEVFAVAHRERGRARRGDARADRRNRLLGEQRADRFLVGNARHRFGQQLRARQDPDALAGAGLFRQRDGIGHDDLVELRL